MNRKFEIHLSGNYSLLSQQTEVKLPEHINITHCRKFTLHQLIETKSSE